MLTFKTSKRHNIVEVAIVYQAINDRSAFEAELNFVQELTTLMVASRNIHNWESDPVVRPNAYMPDQDCYYANIILKFPIVTRVHSDEGLKAYSYAGLYAVLSEISKICEKHRGNFTEFSSKLNLEAMKAPWVLPVRGHGVILREGSRQVSYHGLDVPHSATIGAQNVEVVQLLALGEERAVAEFDKLWKRTAAEYHIYLKEHYPTHPYLDRGPNLDLKLMKELYPKFNWQNLGVFACFKDIAGEFHWEQLGEMHNAKSEDYILQFGNFMLQQPMAFDNSKPLGLNNVFLNDHAYYSFESVM